MLDDVDLTTQAREVLAGLNDEQVAEFISATGVSDLAWARRLHLRIVKSGCGVQYETQTDLGREARRILLLARHAQEVLARLREPLRKAIRDCRSRAPEWSAVNAWWFDRLSASVADVSLATLASKGVTARIRKLYPGESHPMTDHAPVFLTDLGREIERLLAEGAEVIRGR